MRDFKVGDLVKFLNDVGTATVLRVEGNVVIVEDEDGFERSVERAELMDAGDRDQDEKKYGNKLPDVAQLLTQEVGERRMKELQRDFEVRYQHAQATSMSRRDAHMEVDLHIHELVDDQRGLADGAKLAIQMAHFDRMMDIAKREKLRRIVFIHGVGQGVLRHQIRTALDQHHPDCNYREGDPRRYGSGATEVWLGQASWRKP
ncbi:Smr/MutS family protein [Flavobacteriales bacterium]|nr:Smr/MutS family protein [Flavobacteriales bacterium]MEC8335883.1 Smr/MutS family protein [Bacteroidota bacterium]MEC8662935.1 Smr/MutS family protein [Bacteroidota bacterium]